MVNDYFKLFSFIWGIIRDNNGADCIHLLMCGACFIRIDKGLNKEFSYKSYSNTT